MKVAIHHPDFKGSFAVKWIEYCNCNKIEYVVVDCFDTDIISFLQENDITHLLWHFGQSWKDLLTARNILFSEEMNGIKVFPNKDTSWHFDDKISQKYLLESNGIGMPKTYVFFEKEKCKKFINEYSHYPIVAKLRRGSGSTCVELINSQIQAKKYCNRMFSKGINPQSSIFFDTKKRIRKIHNSKDIIDIWLKLVKRAFNFLSGTRIIPFESGYVYFQEFIENNSFDTRVIVIGERAYAFRRMVRKNDFRASGSGNFDYSANKIDINCVKKAFEISKKLKTQSIAIDFVLKNSTNQLVLEISYGFVPRFYDLCEGYWDQDMVFHNGNPILEFDIIYDLLHS